MSIRFGVKQETPLKSHLASDSDRPVDALIARVQEVVRFTLPPYTKLAVMSGGEPALLDLDEGREAWHLGQTRSGDYSGPHPTHDRQAIDQLEALRGEGAEYLLIPKCSFWWLDQHGGFRQHISRRYRVVHREEDACLIIGLHEVPNPELRATGTPDGLPLPPAEMVALTIGNRDVSGWLEGGQRVTKAIRKVLRANGIRVRPLLGILDFGCGCGRVIRHWMDVSETGLQGVDYNPYFVDWCSKTLTFAHFQRNGPDEPLGFNGDSFELVYAYSVFTHLDVESQFFWMNELIRVLRPGGFLVMTVHGTRYVDDLEGEDRRTFDAGEMIVMCGDHSGSNACVVFHPREYVCDTLADELELLDFVPGGSEIPNSDLVAQDILLFRKPH
jgi:SAM-dependent methyltransferase